MSDPFTDLHFNSKDSQNKDAFSDFVSFDEFGKNKQKNGKWTGFKRESQMESNFKEFDFKGKVPRGSNRQPNKTPWKPEMTSAKLGDAEKRGPRRLRSTRTYSSTSTTTALTSTGRKSSTRRTFRRISTPESRSKKLLTLSTISILRSNDEEPLLTKTSPIWVPGPETRSKIFSQINLGRN